MLSASDCLNASGCSASSGPSLAWKCHARRVRKVSSASGSEGYAAVTTAPAAANTGAADSTTAATAASTSNAPPRSTESATRSPVERPGQRRRERRARARRERVRHPPVRTGEHRQQQRQVRDRPGHAARRPRWSPRRCRAATRAPGRARAGARRRCRTTPGCAASRPCRCRRRAAPCRWPARPPRRRRSPPAERVRSQGFSVVPKTGLKVCEPAANSGTLVRPTTTAPAPPDAARRAARRSRARASARTGDPYVVRQPATSWVSLKANGSPCSGPTEAPEASCLVRSGRRRPGSLGVEGDERVDRHGLTASIRSRCRSSSSRAEISRARTAAAIARAEEKWSRVNAGDPPPCPSTTPGRPAPRRRRPRVRKSCWDEARAAAAAR